MTNKKLRIIVADGSLPRLIQIERSLNNLGYFRILPVQNIDDLWALDHESIEPFDAIIVNKEFVRNSEMDLNLFWRATRKINHSLFYDGRKIVPGDDSIKKLMIGIDAPSPWECLKDLKWIKR